MSRSFEKLMTSFLDTLRAVGKSQNTLRNYKSDLAMFGKYLDEYNLDVQNLGLDDLNRYLDWLTKVGLKTNSRRRKIMTMKSFLKATAHHIDVQVLGAENLIPPEKIEKPPRLISDELVTRLQNEQSDLPVGARNRFMISLLRQTGMLVTELLALKKSDIRPAADGAGKILRVTGARSRNVTLAAGSPADKDLDALLGQVPEQQSYLIHGFNRAGPNPERMTPRGVEMLFKTWSKRVGEPDLKPRAMRHLFIVEQLRKGVSESDIMEMVGLRTPYIFKIYHPLVKGIAPELEAVTVSVAPSQKTADNSAQNITPELKQ